MGREEEDAAAGRQGVASYYGAKARTLDVTIAAKEANLRRLEAQRNELNARVRALRDEVGAAGPRGRFFFALFCMLPLSRAGNWSEHRPAAPGRGVRFGEAFVGWTNQLYPAAFGLREFR